MDTACPRRSHPGAAPPALTLLSPATVVAIPRCGPLPAPERGIEFDVNRPGRVRVTQYTAAAAAVLPPTPDELRIVDTEGVWVIRPVPGGASSSSRG